MRIILSQRIDIDSEYDDVPFATYHFPKRYIKQIKPGDRFIYYQGNKSKKEQRYYFGCGVIGKISSDDKGENFYAEILDGLRFNKNIPIYVPIGEGFIESYGYEKVRKKPNPAWQNSIRKISDDAFFEILNLAKISSDVSEQTSLIESESDGLSVLKLLNDRYLNAPPKERNKVVQNHLDRGVAVTRALKSLLGAECQVCGWAGFEKKNGDGYIEAHHLVQLSDKEEGSLCTDNVVLLCPNCHREIHYGDTFSANGNGDYIEISLSNHKAKIRRNTFEYLTSLKNQIL